MVEVAQKADPPVCKIMDYGKYLYREQKKEQKQKSKTGTLKIIKFKFKTTSHDLKTKAKRTIRFLNKGYKVKIEMYLRGRENALKGHAKDKIKEFLDMVKEEVEIEAEKELKKKGPRFLMIIRKK